jgi:UDP-N-acetylmuramate--alanine ligase
VLNNVTLDHKSMEELRKLFGDFLAKARTAVINADDVETATLGARLIASQDEVESASPVCYLEGAPPVRLLIYSLHDSAADLTAHDLAPARDGIAFTVVERGSGASAGVKLRVPGRHNVANALAALAAARACGVPFADAARALAGFTGVRRRLETVGTAGGVTVIDDFAHNPDKIAATLATLGAFPGRLLIYFQPHGYGPLKLMRAGFIESFGAGLREGDVVLISPPTDYGGTTERTLEHRDAIVAGVQARGRKAEAVGDRAAGASRLRELAGRGDRIVVMGARDDTLTTFAKEVLGALGGG